MKYNYKRTFDAVRMSPEHQKRIRSELSSRFSEKQKEDNVVNIKSIRKPRKALVAAVAILASVLLAGFTFGSQIIQLLGGGRIESGTDGSGNNYTSIDAGFETDPVEIRDGQVYFVLDGSDTDITRYCTETTYYQYEQIADNGYRHVVVVGGTPDNLGWAEFVWDENGNFSGSNATTPASSNGEWPEWLELANETLRD